MSLLGVNLGGFSESNMAKANIIHATKSDTEDLKDQEIGQAFYLDDDPNDPPHLYIKGDPTGVQGLPPDTAIAFSLDGAKFIQLANDKQVYPKEVDIKVFQR